MGLPCRARGKPLHTPAVPRVNRAGLPDAFADHASTTPRLPHTHLQPSSSTQQRHCMTIALCWRRDLPIAGPPRLCNIPFSMPFPCSLLHRTTAGSEPAPVTSRISRSSRGTTDPRHLLFATVPFLPSSVPYRPPDNVLCVTFTYQQPCFNRAMGTPAFAHSPRSSAMPRRLTPPPTSVLPSRAPNMAIPCHARWLTHLYLPT